MIRRRSHVVTNLLIFVLAFAGTPIAAEDVGSAPPKGVLFTISLPDQVSGWGLHPQGRRIYAMLSRTKQLVSFDGESGTEINRYSMPADHRELTIKDRHFVFATNKGISVYDRDTGKHVRSIVTSGKPGQLVSTSPDNHYVFALVSDRVGQKLVKVNILNSPSGQSLTTWDLPLSTTRRVAVSRDGEWLIGANGDGRNESTGRIHRLRTDPVKAKPVRSLALPTGFLSSGWSAGEWWVGNTLVGQDGHQTERRYPGDVAISHPRLDIVYSLEGTSSRDAMTHGILTLSQQSTGKRLTAVPLPNRTPSTPSHISHRQFQGPIQIHLASSGRHVLCTSGSIASLVDFQKLGIAEGDPPVRIDVPYDLLAQPGEIVDIRLVLTNREMLDEATFRVELGPDGLVIDDKALRWTPSFEAIGTHPLTINVQIGDRQHSQRFLVHVDTPSLRTGVVPQHLFTDSNGRYLAVFGQPPSAEQQKRESGLSGPPTTVAVVDLQTRKVVVKQPVEGDVRLALVGNRYVFWLPKTANVLHRLEISSDGQVTKLPLRSAVVAAFLLDNDRLVLSDAESKKASTVVYFQDSLKPDVDHPLSKIAVPWSGRSSSRMTRGIQRLGDSMLHYHQRVINESDGATRCFTNISRYARTQLVKLQNPPFNIPSNSQGDFLWRLQRDRNGMRKLGGPLLYNAPSNYWDVSRRYPLVAAVQRTRQRTSAPIAMLEIRHVQQGNVVFETELPTSLATDYRSTYSRNRFLRFSGDWVIITTDDLILTYKIPQEIVKKTVEPLRLLYPMVPMGDVTKAMSFQLQARGGKPPFVFSSEFSFDGLRLSSDTGQVNIDLLGIWRDFIEQVKAGKRRDFPEYHPPDIRAQLVSGGKPLPSVEAFLDIASQEDSKPFSLPMVFSVTDDSGQMDAIAINAIVLGSKPELEVAAEKGRKSIAEAQRKANLERQRQLRDITRDATDEPATTSRLDRLDKRTERIESLLENILKELQKERNARNTDEE